MQSEPEIDRLIFENEKLAVVKIIKDKRRCALPEAVEIMTTRYKELRKRDPERFSSTDEEYWKGFYS